MLALVLLITFVDELLMQQFMIGMDVVLIIPEDVVVIMSVGALVIMFEDVDLRIGGETLIIVVFLQMVACTQKIVNSISFIDRILLPAGFEPAIFGMRIQYPRPARRWEHIVYVEFFSIKFRFSIALAWTRTMNLQLRRLLLYPLSY